MTRRDTPRECSGGRVPSPFRVGPDRCPQPGRRARADESGENGTVETSHPLLEAAKTVALGHVRPDRRRILFRPPFEDADCEALVAIVAGEDPVPVVRRYLSAERAWLSRTAPLVEHLQLRPAA